MTTWTRGRPGSVRAREPALVALLLGALFVIAHAHALPPGKVLAATDLALATRPFATERRTTQRPANPALWDEALQFAPWFAFDSRELSRGSLPLWNPHAGCGAAHAGNDQVELFSPLRLLALLLGPATGLFLLALARHVLGGLGLYLFLRELRLGVAASLAGGVAFAFSGFLVVWQGSPHSAVAAVLGWVLLGVERSARREGARPSVLVALATAFALWGGHAETALHVALAAGAWAVVRAIGIGRDGGARAVLQLGARLGGGVGLGLMLAAPHLLAFAAELRESEAFAQRSGGAQWWLPWRFLALVPFPDLYGNPRDGTSPHDPVQSYLELAGAGTGAAAVALALVGALGPRDERAARIARGALVAAGLALAFALGLPGFAALASVPPLSLARNHRLVLVAAAAIAVAASAGVELALARRARVGRAALAFAGVVALALVARRSFGAEVGQAVADERGRAFRGASLSLAGPILAALAALAVAFSAGLGGLPRRAAGALLVLVLALEQAVVFAGGWNPAVDRADFYPRSPTVDALLEAPAGDRARTLVLGDLSVLPPDVPTAYGLDVVGRYDALGSRTFAPLRDALGPVPPHEVAECFQRVDPRIARVLGVRWILVGQDELDPRLDWEDLAPLPERPLWALVDARGSVGESFRSKGRDVAAVLLQVRLEGTRVASLQLDLSEERRAPGASGVARVATATVVRRAGDLTTALFRFEPVENAGRQPLRATFRRTDQGPGEVFVATAPWPRNAIGSRVANGRILTAYTLVGSVAATSSLASSYRELPGVAARVLEDEGALPRARVVGHAELVGTPEEGVARLRDAAHDPRESVVLLLGESGPESVGAVASASPGRAALESYSPDEVVVRASAPSGGWLVLADAWHPGWSATVDGAPARVLRGDVALRAVRLEAGEHAVVFRFRPPALVAGLALALAGLVALVAVALAPWLERRAS